MVAQRFEPVPGRGPLRDDGVAARIGHVEAVDREVGTGEEGADGRPEQEGACDAVDDQERLEGPLAEDVARLAAVLVGYGLDDEDEQDGHPDIGRSAERRGVEEREGGEEGAAEGDERREGELPFAAEGVDQQRALLFGAPEPVEQRLAPLYEEQEDEQGSQQGDDEPPVVLQKGQRIHCVVVVVG